MLETFSAQEELVAGERAYLSCILQSIGRRYQEISLNGSSDHPLLQMALE